MIWNLYDILNQMNHHIRKDLMWILAYIEKTAQLEIVYIIQELLSKAENEGITFDQLKHIINALCNELEQQKEILLSHDYLYEYTTNLMDRIRSENK